MNSPPALGGVSFYMYICVCVYICRCIYTH